MGNACASDNTSPDTVKIEYFSGVHGRPEPLRVLLHHANVPYVDSSVSLTGWMVRKGTGRTGEMGQLPIISYQGKEMQQATAVLRAIGVERGYYNPRDWRQAQRIDWILDTQNELLTKNAELVLNFNSTATNNQLWQELLQNK